MKSKVVIYKSVYFAEPVKLLLQNLSTINPFAKYISDLHKIIVSKSLAIFYFQ